MNQGASFAWKVLILVNLVLVLLVYGKQIDYNKKVEQQLVALQNENLLLEDKLENISSTKFELSTQIGFLKAQIKRLESQLSFTEKKSVQPEIEVEFVKRSPDPYINAEQIANTDYSIHDEQDCSGEGRGLIALFVDLYLKCPDNVFGYAIELDY